MTNTETPTIPRDQIEITSRFRKDYGDIDQLCYSITKNGLISPVAIGLASEMHISRETTLPYILLAGGRRMRAMEKMDWKLIPVRIYDQPLTELDLRAIELAENLDRKDMAYDEDLALKLEIDRLQKSIHGEKIARSAGAPGWSQADTARLLKISPTTLSKDIKLAEAIENFPDMQLGKCKNKAEAIKRLRDIGKVLVNQHKANAYSIEMSGVSKIFRKLSSSYIVGDCLDTMAKIPSNSLNIIEIDPPYAIDLTTIKKDNSCIGYNEIDANKYISFMSIVFSESFRILKDGSWMIVWFAQDPWFQPIASAIKEVGFKMNLIPAIWTKAQGQTAQPETFLGNFYEAFFYARKGKAKLSKPGRSNIFNFPTIPHTLKYHPTQRPIDLMSEVLITFCPPGSNGFVPFAGSGVTLLAGHINSINLIGTDLTQSYKDGYVVSLKEVLGYVPEPR